MKEEMSKEDRARVFALYLGCNCLYGSEDDKIVGSLTGADIGASAPNVYVNGICHVPVELCQLILKDLSEITDEDAVEVCRMAEVEVNEDEITREMKIMFASKIDDMPYSIADFLRPFIHAPL